MLPGIGYRAAGTTANTIRSGTGRSDIEGVRWIGSGTVIIIPKKKGVSVIGMGTDNGRVVAIS